MQINNSKLNTILLILVIALLTLAVWKLSGNKTTIFPVQYSQTTYNIHGRITSGKGDCMPTICDGACPVRPTSGYDGVLHFVNRDAFDELPEPGDYTTLFSTSPSVEVLAGNYEAHIPSGNYYLMTDEMKGVGDLYAISIFSDEVITKNLRFFQCTSN